MSGVYVIPKSFKKYLFSQIFVVYASLKALGELFFEILFIYSSRLPEDTCIHVRHFERVAIFLRNQEDLVAFVNRIVDSITETKL